MTLMSEQQLKDFAVFVRQWPAGMRVWHRASGTRGVVLGWLLKGDGGVLVDVDYGNTGTQPEAPYCLSAVKVTDNTDGEDWKEGAASA